MKKTFLYFTTIFFISTFLIFSYLYFQNNPKVPENKTTEIEEKSEENIPTSSEIVKNINPALPKSFQNKAPFVSQAPFEIWDDLHEEACEEASLVIVNGFLNNIDEISKEETEKEIQSMINWQINKYGKHKDLNVNEIKDLFFNFYNRNLEISYNINESFFKKILSSGNLIIIPVAGREIKNPYFKAPGPLYHVLVIIGYDDNQKEFITNDPGTRRGKEFRYPYTTIINSIHDFPGKKEEILNGKPAVLITIKNE